MKFFVKNGNKIFEDIFKNMTLAEFFALNNIPKGVSTEGIKGLSQMLAPAKILQLPEDTTIIDTLTLLQILQNREKYEKDFPEIFKEIDSLLNNLDSKSDTKNIFQDFDYDNYIESIQQIEGEDKEIQDFDNKDKNEEGYKNNNRDDKGFEMENNLDSEFELNKTQEDKENELREILKSIKQDKEDIEKLQKIYKNNWLEDQKIKAILQKVINIKKGNISK